MFSGGKTIFMWISALRLKKVLLLGGPSPYSPLIGSSPPGTLRVSWHWTAGGYFRCWPYSKLGLLENVCILPYFRMTWARPSLAPLKRSRTIICFLYTFDFGVTLFIMVMPFPDSFSPSRLLRKIARRELNSYQIGLFRYSYTKGSLPSVFSNYFSLNNTIHQHYTRSSGKFHIKFKRTNYGRFSIKYKGPTIWNTLPDVFYIT